jgi:hypothetical protein
LSRFDRGVQAHVGEIRRLGRVGLAEGAVGVQQAIEGEQHVVGVEVAGRREEFGGVELDAIRRWKV